MKYLYDEGASVSAIDNQGRTASRLAEERGYRGVLQILNGEEWKTPLYFLN